MTGEDETLDEAPETETADPKVALLAAIDAALEPAYRRTAIPGVAQLSDLAVVLNAVKQAFRAAIHGPPELSGEAGESLDVYGDMLRAARHPVLAEEPEPTASVELEDVDPLS